MEYYIPGLTEIEKRFIHLCDRVFGNITEQEQEVLAKIASRKKHESKI